MPITHTLKHAASVLAVLGTTCFLTVIGWRAGSGSMRHHIFLALLGGGALLCALVAFVVFFVALAQKKKLARNYSALLFVSAACVIYVPVEHASSRMQFTIRSLESTYDDLAKKGPPFPPADDESLIQMLNDGRMISSGYWVSADRQKFEIYYHDDSNSHALAYPDRTWDWRGSGYEGPGTSERPHR